LKSNHTRYKKSTYLDPAGAEMQVRALRNVREGEELCVAYINLTEDRATRQRELLEGKHFVCACQRCSQPLVESNDRFLEVPPPSTPPPFLSTSATSQWL